MHLGIVLIFLGFAGEGFSRDEQLLLKPGEQATVGDYTIRLDALRVTDDGQKQMVTGHITVKDADGEDRQDVSGEVVLPQARGRADHRGRHPPSFAEDLYIVMPAFELQEQTASVEVHINPLVNWIWFGFGILAIGTGIALLPERRCRSPLAKLPGRSGDRDDAVAAVDAAVERRGVRAARRDRQNPRLH